MTENQRLNTRVEISLDNELREAGVEVASFRDLHHKPKNFKLAIPIIIRHLGYQIYPSPLKNSMAQAIAFRETNPYWNDLLKIYMANVGDNVVRQGLAVAMAASYSQKELHILVELCKDPAFGDSRLLLLDGLRRSKADVALATLLELADDEKVGKQVTKWLKRPSAPNRTLQ
jgi:hypothetical protein